MWLPSRGSPFRFVWNGASGLRFDKYLNFGSPPIIIRAGFRWAPHAFDLHTSSMRSLRWDIYLITAALQNPGSWQLKETPPCILLHLQKSSIWILMYSRSYQVMKWFNLPFPQTTGEPCIKAEGLQWLKPVAQNILIFIVTTRWSALLPLKLSCVVWQIGPKTLTVTFGGRKLKQFFMLLYLDSSKYQ